MGAPMTLGPLSKVVLAASAMNQSVFEEMFCLRRRLRDNGVVASTHILTEEFAQAAVTAGLRARQNALAAGHAVVFVDDCGRYVEELPDGTRLEVRFRPGKPREFHIEVLGQIASAVK